MGGEIAPNAEVEAKENGNVKENTDLSLSTLSLADFQLPFRPGYGASGTMILLRTNYFKITIDAGKKLFKYSLTLTAKYRQSDEDARARQPAVPPERSRKRRQALALLFQDLDFQMIGHGVATDYGSTIITSKELPFGGAGTKDYVVVYRETEDRDPPPNPILYTFTLLYTGLVPTTELLRYLASTPSDASNFTGKDDAIQALNIIVARTPSFHPGVFQSGNNKFFHYPTDNKKYNNLTGGLIAVCDYYTSVRTSTLRTLLNVNAQTSPFYPAINVLDLFKRHGRDDWWKLERFLRRLRVKTVYMRREDGSQVVKVKTVLGFSQQMDDVVDKRGKVVLDDKKKPLKQRNLQVTPLNSQQVSFKCEEFGNKSITIEEYFKKKYRIVLEAPRAWLLNCGTQEKPVWIPAELCEVMPGQAFRGKLNNDQTTEIMNVAARGPAENAKRITNDSKEVIGFQGKNPSLAAFGVSIESNMIMIRGRILPAPSVTYGRNAQTTSQITPVKASWNMRGKKFAKPIEIANWSFLKLGGAHFNDDYIQKFKEALKNCGCGKADPINPRRGFEAALPGSEDANDASIQKIFQTLSYAKVKMGLVVLPSTSRVTYGYVLAEPILSRLNLIEPGD